MSTPPAKASPGGSRIGRPPQWTISRSRKLARLYVYTTLSIEKIINVLEDDVFRPRKNSAQKTVHKMLDNDPRYLRPESRAEMGQRIGSLAESKIRRRRRVKGPRLQKASRKPSPEQKEVASSADVSSTSGSSRHTASLDLSSSGRPTSPQSGGLRRLLIPTRTKGQGDTSDSDTSSFRVRRIRARLSDCSTDYAQQVSTLLRDFTISNGSEFEDDTPSRRPSAAVSEHSGHPDRSSPGPYEDFPEPGLALPGDFLTAYTRSCADFPGQNHGKGCWCVIADEVSKAPDSWTLRTGELSDRARHVLNNPTSDNLGLRDAFGNTILHLLASREDYHEELLSLAVTSPSLSLVNTGDQTFLHVIHPSWFTSLTPTSPLRQLLTLVQNTAPNTVYLTDHYGRNFFHRAHSLHLPSSVLATLLAPFNSLHAIRPSAFDMTPLSPAYHPPRLSSYPPPPAPPPSTPSTPYLAYHARLLQIIQSAYTSPQTTDPEGRNGLHCLAEASLDTQPLPLKRKASPTSPPSSTPTMSIPPPENPLSTRHRHLLSLISTVDLNAYTQHGVTPLIAFVTHLPDAADDKNKTLQAIFETLIRGGARLEMRNREGETAGMVAARLGRKIALGVLLEHGAKMGVRDGLGRGVLEVVDRECRDAKGLGEYARLEGVRGLLTGRRGWIRSRGEEQVLGEWGV